MRTWATWAARTTPSASTAAPSNTTSRTWPIAREIGDRRGEGAALGNLGSAYDSLGEHRRAAEYHEQHLAITQEVGDRKGEGKALGNLGLAYDGLGEYRHAIALQEKSLAVKREVGDRRGEGNALGNLGIAYQSLGEYRRAIEYHEQALQIDREIGDREGRRRCAGQPGQRVRLPRRVPPRHRIPRAALADRRAKSATGGAKAKRWATWASLSGPLGEYRRAIEHYELQLGMTREIGYRSGEGNALFNMSLATGQTR